MSRIEIVKRDITKMDVDVIVNAADNALLGGHGVDGAIHAAAGPELLEECRALEGCATGDAKITKAYRLNAKAIIHTVGPVWNGGRRDEDAFLVSCYDTSMRLAVKHHLKTIAFPSISTGTYQFPLERAASIAINTVRKNLALFYEIEKVYFVCYDQKTYDVYDELFDEELLDAFESFFEGNQDFEALGKRAEYNMPYDGLPVFEQDYRKYSYREQRVAYLKGAKEFYYNGAFNLANAPYKAKVLMCLLVDLRCEWVEFTRTDLIPTCFTIKFKASEIVADALK